MATAILTWTPNTEADLASYKVYRNGTVIATVPKGTATYQDTLTVDGDYTYALTAVDTAGNESLKSVSVTKTVNTNPPVAPVGLTVVLS
jgi:fibronectin type 3 domain-containing protein